MMSDSDTDAVEEVVPAALARLDARRGSPARRLLRRVAEGHGPLVHGQKAKYLWPKAVGQLF